ncbi:hypothetical protein KC131_25990 [Pseudomonas sp. JQ170]|uniref:hypothetical protein n=1 Tax=unclassified Pseudomonas TaxID=196821 RepID=UPI00264C712F|nr:MULTISPECIES: hypothetical protein [unclassified Pseudomonas]MDN7144101.1 hypothetical protein [Pseudomonas sp. JQ170]WRO74180.1 hypothetical protein U9R80_16815 [Pseudomonas sp. 170C]
MHKKVGLFLAIVSVAGCATSSMNYTPPSSTAVVNSKKVTKDFDRTWDDLVRQLSSDFFVINNIDKSSRLINVSFSTSRPSEYVDCGSTVRKFSNARGEQVYNYMAADSSQFAVTNAQHVAFNATRTTKLEGRVNIYVAPAQGGTDVSVNTKYVFSVRFNAVGFDGNPGGGDSSTFDFSTKSPHESQALTCYAKGTLESRILEMAM